MYEFSLKTSEFNWLKIVNYMLIVTVMVRCSFNIWMSSFLSGYERVLWIAGHLLKVGIFWKRIHILNATTTYQRNDWSLRRPARQATLRSCTGVRRAWKSVWISRWNNQRSRRPVLWTIPSKSNYFFFIQITLIYILLKCKRLNTVLLIFLSY